MKYLIALVVFAGLFACVPAKKYNELLEREQQCNEELKRFKTSALDNEAALATIRVKQELLEKEANQLRADTARIGSAYRELQATYQKMVASSSALENQLDQIKNRDARELARMQADLEAKIIETQRKEDALQVLEKELKGKEKLLQDREARVNELESLLAKKEEAVHLLKEKVARALLGFKDKGLTVEERDGRIYVSLEAKLLFASGSTVVEPEGARAIIELAKAIENERDLDIIVEGHTDTDPLRSRTHPRSNWELSVLRATAVVEIMTGNSAVDPRILMAAGRSEYHPVDENNKAKNRRIEVIIAPNLDELFDMIQQK